MSSTKININGVNFQINKLDALSQFHVARRMAPLLTEVGPLVKVFKESGLSADDLRQGNVGGLLAAIQPITSALAALPDTEANAILFGLLSSVEMEQSVGGFARVCQGNQLMFANLPMPTLLQLAGRAAIHNFADFFSALPSPSSQGEPTPNAPSNG